MTHSRLLWASRPSQWGEDWRRGSGPRVSHSGSRYVAAVPLVLERVLELLFQVPD
jgi:hypothetical protein